MPVKEPVYASKNLLNRDSGSDRQYCYLYHQYHYFHEIRNYSSMAAKKIILAFWFYNLIFDITSIKEEPSLKKRKKNAIKRTPWIL